MMLSYQSFEQLGPGLFDIGISGSASELSSKQKQQHNISEFKKIHEAGLLRMQH